MRHGGAQGRITLRFFQTVTGPAHGRDTHGRTVAETVVRLATACDDPAEKTLTVARPAVDTAIFVHGVDEGLPADLFLPVGLHQPPGHGHGHHRIVGETGTGRKQRKGLRSPLPRMELVRTAHHVTDDGSQHDRSPCYTAPHGNVLPVLLQQGGCIPGMAHFKEKRLDVAAEASLQPWTACPGTKIAPRQSVCHHHDGAPHGTSRSRMRHCSPTARKPEPR